MIHAALKNKQNYIWKVPVDHVVQLGQVGMWEGWFLLL